MVAVPAATPVRMPVDEPIVAMPSAAETHVPPATGSERVLVVPTHMLVKPVIAGGVHIDQRYTWLRAGLTASVLVKVLAEGTGDALTFGSVCQSVVLLPMPIVAPRPAKVDGP
jgi:hypothetical protein